MLPRICLADVNVHLGGRHVLHAITWSLEAGQHWAFCGPNGSGKSTLLRVIAGTQWIDADGGSRRYSSDGARPEALGRARRWIRFVSAEQHERYVRLDLSLTGRALIESGYDDTVYVHRPLEPQAAAKVDALLERFELRALAQRPVRELSTGQLRRLLVARALLGAPRVLVLDEFTNGLDRPARAAVLRFLDEIAPDVALVIASHRPGDLPAAVTHTAELHAGRLGTAPARAPAARHAPVAAPPAAQSDDILLRFEHADVYRGDRLVLRDISWALRRGQHTVIRGVNGAGKSTFAGLIAGTIPAATGAAITRFGETGPFDVWRLKEKVAHVCDDLQNAYDLTEPVEAVIASGFASSIGLFAEPSPAERSTVDDLLTRLGLDALRGRSFAGLSFGERRKILIARSLVRPPAIFILDEIWNGLDVGFRAALGALLADLRSSGTTLVAIAHDDDDEVLAFASRVCTIADGRLSE